MTKKLKRDVYKALSIGYKHTRAWRGFWTDSLTHLIAFDKMLSQMKQVRKQLKKELK